MTVDSCSLYLFCRIACRTSTTRPKLNTTTLLVVRNNFVSCIVTEVFGKVKGGGFKRAGSTLALLID